MRMTVLGSTGSIGTQALDCARRLHWDVVAITVNKNIKLAEEQIREHCPEYCAVADERLAEELKIKVRDTSTKILSGDAGVLFVAEYDKTDLILNSIVGMAGLRPTLAAIKVGARFALANKESLVCAGDTVMKIISENGVEIIPVDSEHSAIFRCLRAEKNPKRLILTASGGPFFGKTEKELENVTVGDVLAHPTWSMGAKITVDSATLMNKGFEIIEACHLFGVTPDKTDVVVHRQSIIHSMVEFCDNSVIAELSYPDMRECIQYAMTYPEAVPSPLESLDFAAIGSLTFHKHDGKTFPLLDFAGKCFTLGGVIPSVLNGANEEAVKLFLEGKIGFLDISRSVIDVTESYNNITDPTVEDIILSGNESRIRIREFFNIKQ